MQPCRLPAGKRPARPCLHFSPPAGLRADCACGAAAAGAMKAAAWIAKAAARAKWKKSEARPQPASGQSAPTPPHSCAQLMRPHTAGRPPSGLVFPTFPPPAIPRLYLDTRFCLANRQKPRSARQCCAARYQNRKNLWITHPAPRPKSRPPRRLFCAPQICSHLDTKI